MKIKERDVEIEDRPIGEGGFGVVRRGTLRTADNERMLVAIKTIKLNAQPSGNVAKPKDVAKSRMTEADLCLSLDHTNIVKVFGLIDMKSGNPAIVMELANGGPLTPEKMKSYWNGAQKTGNDRELRKMSMGLVSGLQYLHSKKIAHRDLKPANILCFESAGQRTILKISDFGLARVLPHSQAYMESRCGTNKYLAPEIHEAIHSLFQPPHYSKDADIYSLSLILFEIHSGGLDPFHGRVGPKKVEGMEPQFPLLFPNDIRRVVARGYSKNPKQRPALDELREVLFRQALTGGRDPDQDVQRQRDCVEKMVEHAWGYYTSSWQQSSSSEWNVTECLDVLDTLYIAGLDEEFERGVDLVERELLARLNEEGILWLSSNSILGGLLSSYALSGDERLLRVAVDLADLLLPAFDTPSGIPMDYVVFSNAGQRSTATTREYGVVSLENLGSFFLEFTYLSQLTGDSKYADKVKKVRQVLQAQSRISNGLYPDGVYVTDGRPCDTYWWAPGRFYDTLLKTWLLSGRQDLEAREMCAHALDVVTKVALQKSESGLYYLPLWAEVTDAGDGDNLPSTPDFDRRMRHEACFWGGTYALWGREMRQPQQLLGPAPNSPAAANEDKARAMLTTIGHGLAATCRQAYDKTETKLGPWWFSFEGDGSRDAEAVENFREHWLEHEAVESYFILWRLTGDEKYRDWGWDVVLALEEHCRRDRGYSSIEDVNQVPTEDDPLKQPTWFLGATLKYLYLLFSDRDFLSLDQWVFNAWGHPLPVAGANNPQL